MCEIAPGFDPAIDQRLTSAHQLETAEISRSIPAVDGLSRPAIGVLCRGRADRCLARRRVGTDDRVQHVELTAADHVQQIEVLAANADLRATPDDNPLSR